MTTVSNVTDYPGKPVDSVAGMDAAGWDERYAASELVWSAEPNRFVAEVCADLAPGRALDLAAGEGRNAIWLAQRGWTVTATDFSAVGLDKGRRLADHAGVAERIAWVAADATTTDWPAEFDLVVVAYLQLVEAERREAVRARFRRAAVRGPSRPRRPRHHEHRRGHRRPPGSRGADDRRGRARSTSPASRTT